jgi:hypothetical protein
MHDILSTEIRRATAADLAPMRAIAEAAYRPYVARNGEDMGRGQRRSSDSMTLAST